MDIKNLISEMKKMAASEGLYDDKTPCKKAVLLGDVINVLKLLDEDAISRSYLLDIAAEEGAYDYVSAFEISKAPSIFQEVK